MKVASIEKDNKRIIWLDFVKFISYLHDDSGTLY